MMTAISSFSRGKIPSGVEFSAILGKISRIRANTMLNPRFIAWDYRRSGIFLQWVAENEIME
ncbi:MAG: hypothetical protein MUF02_03255 [Acidobacteria bacterium]|nr:hypothetical protein [Acidobacteriota bacterium]